MNRSHLSLLIAGQLAALCGCSSGEKPAYARSADGARGPTIIEPSAAPYVPTAVPQPATIVGTVLVSGALPDDAPATVTRDQRVCGNTITQITVSARDGRLAGALVWLAEIRSGKALPVQRRFELVQERCTFTPLVQPVIAGGTLNIRTDDAMISRSVLVDTRTLDTLAVVPFTDAGQVVPVDAQLRTPGLLEIRSTTHPWMRAWVAVMDHPYAAQTDTGGRFKLDNVPPGRYAIRAWHPRFGVATDTVSVGANATDSLQIRLGTNQSREQR